MIRGIITVLGKIIKPESDVGSKRRVQPHTGLKMQRHMGSSLPWGRRKGTLSPLTQPVQRAAIKPWLPHQHQHQSPTEKCLVPQPSSHQTERKRAEHTGWREVHRHIFPIGRRVDLEGATCHLKS
jgi:hypothetical protein